MILEYIERRVKKEARTSKRQSHLAVFEILFRRQLGEGYFNRATLIAVMLSLVSLKIFADWDAYSDWWSLRSNLEMFGLEVEDMQEKYEGWGSEYAFPFCVMDAFILLILFLGVYHLIEQRRLRKEGKTVHSQFMGISHFGFLGKYFDAENPQLGAILYIEPAIALILAWMAYQHSFWFGILGFMGAVLLWYENYWVVQQSKRPLVATEPQPLYEESQMLFKVANESVEAAVPLGREQQEPEPQEEASQTAEEKPSFTTMVYRFIGGKLDNYLAANQDRVEAMPFLAKIEKVRAYFKTLNVNRRKSFNFFVSATLVFLVIFFWALSDGSKLSDLILFPLSWVMIWASIVALYQLKPLDYVFNKIMRLVFVFGLIPSAAKGFVTGLVKFVVFLILSLSMPLVTSLGIVYFLYRVVMAFGDSDKLPPFERE